MATFKAAFDKMASENPHLSWVARDSATYFYNSGEPVAKLSGEEGAWLIENRIASYTLKGLEEVPDAISRSARFSEGPEGAKEFDAWFDSQPKDFQKDWLAEKERNGDKFKEEAMMDKTNGPVPAEIRRMADTDEPYMADHFDSVELSELLEKEEAGLIESGNGDKVSPDASVRGNVRLALLVPEVDAPRIQRIISSALRDAGFEIGAGDVPDALKKNQFTSEDNPKPKGSDADGDGKKNEKKPFESKKAEFDAAEIGKTTPGPLESHSPQPVPKGEFTSQENEELTKKQESGQLPKADKKAEFDAGSIAKPTGGPLEAQADEPYMKEFTGQETVELTQKQESGQLPKADKKARAVPNTVQGWLEWVE